VIVSQTAEELVAFLMNPLDPSKFTALTADALTDRVKRLGATNRGSAAVALIERHWDLYSTTSPEALLSAVNSLPGETLIDNPSLLVVANYLKHLTTGLDPRRFYDRTGDDDASAIAEQATLRNRLVANSARVAGLRTGGRIEQSRRSAIEGRRMLERAQPGERAALGRLLPHFLLQWGRSNEVSETGGIFDYEEAFDLAVLTDQHTLARRAAASLAWTYADHGRLIEAQAWINRASGTHEANPRYDAPLYLAGALISADRRDADSAEEYLAALDEVPAGEYWAADLWVRSQNAHTNREAAIIEERLSSELSRLPRHYSDKGAHRRHVTAARFAMATLHREPFQPEATTETTVYDELLAALRAYSTGELHEVLRLARRPASAEQSPRVRAPALLVASAAHHELARYNAAREAFTRAHALIEYEGLYSAYGAIVAADLAALFSLARLTSSSETVNAQAHTQDTSVPSSLARLTRRERQVLALLGAGRTSPEIAAELFISVNTVKTVLRSVYTKLGVHTRREAAEIAHRFGIV
jgi:DNA-binding CsgD family transcriptional regulator